MNDWYSSYLLGRERQRELIRQAEQRNSARWGGQRRLLDAGQGTVRARRSGGRPDGRFGISTIRRRIGGLLASLGQTLQ
jgi:hypothetical protein